jgi:hypothetical protein
MREDQLQRLQDLTEKLADSFLLEADPAEWPGDGKSPADISQQERGDRYWCKKNAMATGGVLKYTLDLVRGVGVNSSTSGEHDGERETDLERQIISAEKRAADAVARVLTRAKKRGADERTGSKG